MSQIKYKFNKFILNNKLLSKFWDRKNIYIFLFFCFLFFVIVLRLFFVQVVGSSDYEYKLNIQHGNTQELLANRWNVYAYNNSNTPTQLTDNIKTYDFFVDPKFVWDKEQTIDLIAPVLYEHLCNIYKMQKLDKYQCVRNLELFSNTKIIPDEKEFFYYGSGIVTDWYWSHDFTWYNMEVDNILSWFSYENAIVLIKKELDNKIEVWYRKLNYMWYFNNDDFIEDLNKADFYFIETKWDYNVYVDPHIIKETWSKTPIDDFKALLEKHWYLNQFLNIDKYFVAQENRYAKIASNINPIIAQQINQLKRDNYHIKDEKGTPLLHGLWLEKNTQRYYPYNEFMSNIIWYLDDSGRAFYWIEEYFDDILAGENWEIQWRASNFMWTIWVNDFEVKDVSHWKDVYLTIDIWIQKQIELIAQKWQEFFKADSVSILIYNPNNWHIKASANYPTFNSNNYNDAYTLMPLNPELGYLIDNETYVDIPIYIKTWWETRLATTYERVDTSLDKYIAKNIFWPQVFVDRNISSAYEPGSIFKSFTTGIWIDTDEIRMYDFYDDPWQVQVWPYIIKNASLENCYWDISFSDALIYSCNVWMIRIAQKLWQDNFYNYLDKLWFGQKTWIELANEDPGEIESVSTISKAKFFNNTFGQWLLATPIQIAAAYAPLINWWVYVKPTILAWTYDPNTDTYQENTTQVIQQIFKPETAEDIKNVLYEAMEKNKDYIQYIQVPWYDLWWKSSTSQIAYRGSYQNWLWWTNGSFVWFITKWDPEYIVVVQVRRPRTLLWGSHTSGQIFRDVAKFLLGYSFIEKKEIQDN